MAKEQITIESTVYDGPDRETRLNMIYKKLLQWTLEKRAANAQMGKEQTNATNAG